MFKTIITYFMPEISWKIPAGRIEVGDCRSVANWLKPKTLFLELWPGDRNVMPGFELNISHGSQRFPSCLSPLAMPSPATPALLPLFSRLDEDPLVIHATGQR
jgi:hypothetical protein